MNRQQKIILSLTGIIIVSLSLLGLTYGFFLTQINGNTQNESITVTTANLKLDYIDGNGILSPANVLAPDTDAKFLDSNGNIVDSKVFAVTNTGNAIINNYGIILDNINITYAENGVTSTGEEYTKGQKTYLKYPESMIINMTCKTYVNYGENNQEEIAPCSGINNGHLSNTSEVIHTNNIDVGQTHVYELKMRYIDNGKDQSPDMNKNISVKIDVVDMENTIDIEGTVATYSSGDYVQINSDPKKSNIVFDEKTGTYKYKLVGIKPDEHEIGIYNAGSKKGSSELSIVKGVEASVSGNEVTITNTSRTLNIDIKNDYSLNINNKIIEKIPITQYVKVGDYVAYDYKPNSYTTPTIESGKSVYNIAQSFNSAADGNVPITKWRVLSVEENKLELIADIDGMPTSQESKLVIYGKNGIINGPTILNEINKTLYSGEYGVGRSLNLEDILSLVEGTELIDIAVNKNKNYTDINGKRIDITENKTVGEIEEELNMKISNRVTIDGKDVSELTIDYLYFLLHAESTTTTIANTIIGNLEKLSEKTGNPYWIASTMNHLDFKSDVIKYRHNFISSGGNGTMALLMGRNLYESDDTETETVVDTPYNFRPVIELNPTLTVEPNQVNGEWIIKR